MTETFALPTADCTTCESVQVVYGVLNSPATSTDDAIAYRCLRCDSSVSSPNAILNAAQANEEGYVFERPLPVKSSERGCRGGACGVQQVDLS